jgi:hypothetical protein
MMKVKSEAEEQLALVRTLLGEPGITELTPDVKRRARALMRKAARQLDGAFGGPVMASRKDGKCKK